MTKRVTSRFILQGDNQLNNAFGKARTQVDELNRSAVRLRGVFATIGVAAIVRGIISNTIEAEDAVSQLNATLKSTGRFSETTSQALQDYAAALQNVTTFGDEAIVVGESQLTTFTKIGSEIFPRATEAALDMATKMRTDLKESIVQVGKALQDPILGITALRRVGVNFSDAQKDVIKNLVETAQVARAQDLILKELETEFGGSARAARDTFGGAIKALGNTLGGLQEGKGGSLKGATQAINDLNESLNDPALQRGLGDTATGILRIVQVSAEGISELGNLGQQIGYAAAYFAGNVSEADELQQRIREVDRALHGSIFSRPLKFLTTSREELEKLKADLEEALRKANYDNLGFVRPTGKKKPNLSGLDDPLAPITVTAQKLPFEKWKEWTKTQSAANGVLSQAIAEWDEIQKAHESAAASLQDVLDTLYPVEAAGRQLGETLKILSDAATQNGWSQEKLAEAVGLATKQFDEQVTKVQGTKSELDQYAVQAARDIQSAFADYLFDPFEKGLKGMLRGFVDVIRRMLAEAAAAQLAKSLFGDFGSSGKIGGLVGTAISAIGAFGGGGSGSGDGFYGPPMAAGGSFSGMKPFLVGEHGPEVIMPGGAGTVIPNHKIGGTNVTVNIDARESDNPGRLLALVPLIQSQIEQSMIRKSRRGYLG